MRVAANAKGLAFAERILCELSVVRTQAVAVKTYYMMQGTDEDEAERLAKKSTKILERPSMRKYIKEFRDELRLHEFRNFCSDKGITMESFREVGGELSAEDIRKKNYDELERLKRDAEGPTEKAAIIKQQTDLMGAKLKQEDSKTAADEYIHYYLPLSVDAVLQKIKDEDERLYVRFCDALEVYNRGEGVPAELIDKNEDVEEVEGSEEVF